MKIYSYLNIFWSIFTLPLFAQVAEPEVRVETGNTLLQPGQGFEVRVVITNSSKRPEVIFPALDGLEKGSVTLTRNVSRVDGRAVLTQTVLQQYFPVAVIAIDVPPFTVTVDSKEIKVDGLTLHFSGAADDSLQAAPTLAADGQIPDEIAREDVFLTIKTNKRSVFLREGFGVYLSLYVVKDIPLRMDFYDLNNQLQAILKKLKPDGCWEENTWIEEVRPRNWKIGDRDFTEYRLYQSVFYPLIQKDVHFPTVGLKMKIGEAAADSTEEGIHYRVFYARPVQVVVKPLPPHPKREIVPVGSYQLTEFISANKVAAGESFRYRFGISGEGNISAIPAPGLPPVSSFDFYPPEVSHVVQKSSESVKGEKSFEYTIVGKQNGLYPLEGYFHWIYFDPVLEQYDTLRSQQAVEVVGVNRTNGTAVNREETSLYANLEQMQTTGHFTNYRKVFRIIMNVVVILMLFVTVWLFRR